MKRGWFPATAPSAGAPECMRSRAGTFHAVCHHGLSILSMVPPKSPLYPGNVSRLRPKSGVFPRSISGCRLRWQEWLPKELQPRSCSDTGTTGMKRISKQVLLYEKVKLSESSLKLNRKSEIKSVRFPKIVKWEYTSPPPKFSLFTCHILSASVQKSPGRRSKPDFEEPQGLPDTSDLFSSERLSGRSATRAPRACS